MDKKNVEVNRLSVEMDSNFRNQQEYDYDPLS